MNRYQDFAEEELMLLKSTPMLAGAVIATLGNDGVISAAREFWASAKVVSDATVQFPGNQLIALIHGELHDPESYEKSARKPR